MRIKTPYIILFLMFVVLGVYYPTLFAPFSAVDDTRMVNSYLNKDHFSLIGVFLPGWSAQYYRPLLKLTFWADKYLWGLEESFMHLENVLLHMLNVLLVYFIACRVQVQGDVKKGVALAAALLFALHPLNSEAVIWISGRTDLLAGLFILLSFAVLLFSLQRGSIWGGAASAFFYLMGCFSKESAVFFLPGALFVIFLVKERKEAALSSSWGMRGRFMTGAMFCLMPVIYFVIRHMGLKRGDRGITHVVANSIGDVDILWHRLYIMVKVAGFYAKKLFVPVPLNFGIITVPGIYMLPGVGLILLALYWLWKRNMTSALFFTALSVGSSSLLIAIHKLSWTPVAERYMYMPCAFFAVALTMVVWRFASSFRLHRVCPALLVMILVVFCYVTSSRSILWQDNLALARDTAQKSPYFGAAKNDMAVELLKRGKKEEALRILDSVDVGTFQAASLNKALVLTQKGNLEGAREYLQKRLEDPVPYKRLIIERLIAVDEMIRDRAIDDAEKEKIHMELLDLLGRLHALTGDPFCYYRMGRVALAMGRKEEAGKLFFRAYEGSPKDAYYRAPAGKLAGKLISESYVKGSD